MAILNYSPSGRILERFHLDDTSFFRTLLGPLGSGKTTACCYELLRRIVSQRPDSQGIRHSRWLVVRNTVPELETTTLPSWKQHFGTELGPWKASVPITHQLRFSPGDGTLVNADVIFLGLDGPDAANKIRGMELTGAWVNEAKDVPRGVIDMLTGRVGRFPSKKMGGPTWFGIIADTNMPDDDHWLYKMAEVDCPEGWAFYRQPGGVYKVGERWVVNAQAENLENLPPNYYQNQLAGKPEEWIRVYLAAEYGYVADGRPVFPEYSDIHHVDDLDPLPGVDLFVGCDFGLTPAAVIMQIDAYGRKLVLDEFVTESVGAVAFGKGLASFLSTHYPNYTVAGAWGDPAGGKRQQSDEKTIFQIVRGTANIRIDPAPGNNELMSRREAVAAPLTRFIDGRPGLIINRRCTKLRAGLAGKYCFRRINVKGDVFADRPDKGEYSHVCEALQYVCLGLGEGRQLVEIKGRPNLKRVTVITGTRHRHRVVRRRA